MESTSGQISEIFKLRNWLLANAPTNMLMPLRTGEAKNPLHKHKDGQWSWEKADHFFQTQFGLKYNVGILLQDIIVIDADSEQDNAWLLRTYPDLNSVCRASTSKGFHYYLLRTPQCDELRLFDGARQFSLDNGLTKMDIDLKTVTSKGTGGVIAVYPSKNKQWVLPPWEKAPEPMPEYVALGLAGLRVAKASAKKPGRPQTVAQAPAYPLVLKRLGFVDVQIQDAIPSGYCFIANNRSQERKCPCCRGVHDSNRWWYVVYNQYIHVKSHSGNCTVLVEPLENFCSSFLKAYPQRLPVTNVCQRYLTDDSSGVSSVIKLSCDGGVYCIDSGCDTAKSTALMGTIHQAAHLLGKKVEDVRVFLLSTRIAFADSRVEDLKRFKFAHYRHIQQDAHKSNSPVHWFHHNKIVCSMETMYKMDRCRSPLETSYDLVWFDEAEAITSNMTNMETMPTGLLGCVNMFEWFFKTSRWIIWMDGTSTRRGMECLESLMSLHNRLGVCVKNHYKPQIGRIAHHVKDLQTWTSILREKLKAGKKIVIVMGAKRQADRIVNFLSTTGISFKYYSSASYDASMQNVNLYWTKVQVVIYTATILNGIDMHTEHFDLCMLYGSAGRGPNMRDLFQMHLRVRKLKDKEIYYTIQHHVSQKYMVDPCEIKATLPSLYEEANELADARHRTGEAPCWLQELYALNLWESNLSAMYSIYMFNSWLKKSGYEIQKHNTKHALSEIPEHDKMEVWPIFMKSELHACVPFPFSIIPDLKKSQYEAVQRKYFDRLATPLEAWSIRKYEFCKEISAKAERKDVAAAFEVLQANNKYRDFFCNMQNEIRNEATVLMRTDFDETRYNTVANLRALKLQKMQAIVTALGIRSTYECDQIVTKEFIIQHAEEIMAALADYHKCNFERMQDNRKRAARADTKQQTQHASIMSKVRSVFVKWSGHQFKQKQSGSGKYIRYILQESPDCLEVSKLKQVLLGV